MARRPRNWPAGTVSGKVGACADDIGLVVRAIGTLKLVAYRGTSILGGDSAMLKLSYGRVFVGVAKLDQWPLTLDPQLAWQYHTHGAPGKSLLPQETILAHVQYVAALQNTHPEDGRPHVSVTTAAGGSLSTTTRTS